MTERELAIVDCVRRHTFKTLQNGVEDEEAYRARGHVATWDPFCCVAATRVAIDVLRDFYIFAKPMKVVTMVFNRTLWEHVKVGGLPEDAPEGGILRHAGAKDGPARTGWLNGHLVAIVERELLLDCSAEQFGYASADKPIPIEIESLAIDLRSDQGRRFLLSPDDHELIVETPGFTAIYRKHQEQDGFFDAPDWRPNIDRDDVADQVKKKVYEEVENDARHSR